MKKPFHFLLVLVLSVGFLMTSWSLNVFAQPNTNIPDGSSTGTTGTGGTTSPAPDGFSVKESGAPLPGNLPTLGLENEQSPVSLVERVFLNYIITPVFFIAGGVAVIVILYSSFRIISARGEEEGMTAAKNSLIWAILGLGLIMISYTLVRNVVQIIIGIL